MGLTEGQEGEGVASVAGEREMVANSKYSGRVFVKAILGRADEGVGLIGQRVTVGGWVKTGRVMGKTTSAFLEVNDGSCVANLQVLVDANVAAERQLTLTGTSVLVEGQLVQPPEGKNQKVELLVEKILHVGTVNAAKYPIAKAKLSLESLRSQLHLRARTNTVSGSNLVGVRAGRDLFRLLT
jgi:asparaginyl-tRNA synthetase